MCLYYLIVRNAFSNFIDFLASSTSDVSAPATPVASKKEEVNISPSADDSPNNKKKKRSNHGSKSDLYNSKNSSDFPKDVMNQVTFFQRKQKKGTIDVWWLYDDGGETLLYWTFIIFILML